jgi:hypothetical protein
MNRLTGAVAALLILAIPVVQAQQPSVPPVELPKPLRPCTEIPKVLAAASQVLLLMKSAKVVLHASSDRPAACNNDHTISVYRGMVVAHAAHKLFVNRMELGWFTTERLMSATGDEKYRALLRVLSH